MAEINEIFVAYEPWQTDQAREQGQKGATTVCLDYLVERKLERENIPFVSMLNFIDSETGAEEWWLLAQEVAREWYRLPAMKFFEYKSIRIGEALEASMTTEYLMRLFYYARIYAALKKAYPNAHVSIPYLIVKDSPTDGCLVNFERRAVVDAARMVGLPVTVLGRPVTPRKRSLARTAWNLFLVRIYNAFVSFAPHRRFKIYAGEYWSHFAPIIERMDNVELVLTETSALKKMSWRQLLMHRVRVRNPDTEIRGADTRAAMRISHSYREQWESAKKDVEKYLASVRGDLDWSPVLEACEYLMTFSQKVIADIDAFQRIMEEEKIDVVLESASVGGRHHHFFTLARVAARLHIPSLELQHAAAIVDPRQMYSRIETDYLATFGSYTSSWYERAGAPRNRLIPIGSPRFDECVNECASACERGGRLFTQLGLDSTRPVLFAAVPYSDVNLFMFDSYQLADFFKTMHAAQSAIPGMQVLFKCRNYRYVDTAREYLQELSPADSVVTGNEDIFALLSASDAAVCGNSTVIYQAMLAGKPLVLYPWQAFDTHMARVYEHAAPLARTTDEAAHVLAHIFTDSLYREELLARETEFLKGYSFDGEASSRAAAFIQKLATATKRDLPR